VTGKRDHNGFLMAVMSTSFNFGMIVVNDL
jgi:hypothetical protein